MPNLSKRDVIIVGAGPAGALLGYWLARQDLDILIIEKKTFPRQKPCGGGLTRRSLALLPFDISQVVEDRTTVARVTLSGKLLFERQYNEPIITMVMRDKLDALLVEEACRAGAVFRDGTTFENVSGSTDGLTVKTNRRVYKTEVIVGADGVGSRVAGASGLQVNSGQMLALEAELYPSNRQLISALKGSAHFDFNALPSGYGWVFPKNDHLSVGVMTCRSKLKGMKRYLQSYLQSKGLPPTGNLEFLRGHRIPYLTGSEFRLAGSRNLLIGDAAGIADPITGEGIYYALRQAQIAAGVITGYFKGKYSSLELYNHRMRNEFLRDMTRARQMSVFFYRLPKLNRVLWKIIGSRLADRFLAVASGSASYQQLFSLRTIGHSFFKQIFE